MSTQFTVALRELGAAGESWLAGLPELVASLEADWSVTVGAALAGGNTSYVAEATASDGTPVVLKASMPPGMPGFVPFEQQLAALRLVGGDPYVRLLRHDHPRRAFLFERLGLPLANLGWPVPRQLDTLVRTAVRGWRPVRAGQFPGEAAKARWFGEYVAATWEELGRPCPEAVAQQAVRYAAEREAAVDPGRAVLVHGDAHPFNLLQVPGTAGRFRLIDPEGVAAGPALELGVILRNLDDGLADRDPAEARMIMTHNCRQAGRLARADPEAIWQWTYLQRVANGLNMLSIGEHAQAHKFLAGMAKLTTAWPAELMSQAHALFGNALPNELLISTDNLGADSARFVGRPVYRVSMPNLTVTHEAPPDRPTAVLIVIDPAEADKCRQIIEMGHPRWDLWPIVIDPLHAPAADGAGPYLTLFLACLPALDMADPAVARRVLAAILDTGASDADRRKLVTIILKRASRAAHQILEDLMTAVEWKDDWVESFVNVGKAEGIEEGKAEGKAVGIEEGKAEGRAEGRAETVASELMRLLSLRKLGPGKKHLALIADCSDVAILQRWFDRAATAANAKEVFAD